MLKSALELANYGFAVHWLHPKKKAPIGEKWSEVDVISGPKLEKTYRNGNNVGFRPGAWSYVGGGYLIVIDMDVREAEYADDAMSALKAKFPSVNFDTCPSVISGSGGASRHFFVLTDSPVSGGVVAHSAGNKLVWSKERKKDVKKNDWEIQVLATGSNVVLPPSIHPETDAPYIWEREFDWDDVELELHPVVPAAEVLRAMDRDSSESSVEVGSQEPMGVTPAEIEEDLSEIPNVNLPYEEWINVVGAVQFETTVMSAEDKELAFKALENWSKQSDKHDAQYLRTKFRRGFKNRSNRTLVTWRTFKSQANDARMLRRLSDIDDEFEDLGEEDEGSSDDDLLGTTEVKKPVKKTKKPKWASDKAPDWVKEMNRKHALIIIGGKASVMNFFTDDQGVEDHELWDTKTFHDWYLSKGTVLVAAGKDAKGKARFKDTTMSHAFMGNEYRRGYERGYIFDPKKSTEDGFNLFVGWGVEPKKGDCSKILWHVKNVMCNGDETAYEYFLDYFTHLFQRPWEIPRAAIVIRSGEGAGKDTWAEYISRIVGRYMPKITGQDQFFGNFNGFLKNALFVNMQEAFVGSQQQNEKLKQYITERTIKVENKYQNAYDTPNLMRLFITSNNFRVVAASESARRFLVLKASEQFISNGDAKRDVEIKAYFDALYDELNGSGPAALLHFLLNRDLVNFPRIPPATQELSSQVALNWKGMKKFFYYAAANGTFDDEDADPVGTKEKWLKEGLSIEKSHLRALFNKWCRGQQKRDLDEFEPTMTAFTQAVYTYLGAKDVRPRVGKDATSRPRFYLFPRLEFAREAMSKAARGKLEWHDEQETDHLQNLPDEEDDLG